MAAEDSRRSKAVERAAVANKVQAELGEAGFMTSREIIQLKRDVDAAKNAAHAATHGLATVSDRDAPEWTAYYAKLAEYRRAVAITGYPGFLVLCNDDSDQPMARVLATRTVFTEFEKAVDYAKGICAARDPEIIGCPFALEIVRKIDNPCEKCGTPTHWMVEVNGRIDAFWCGC